MQSESGDTTRPTRVQATTAAYPPPKLSEPLPCPRCHSTNTKFCYYNNYNLAQPRHFCKSCRRYWTHGGTLRDVPVGGGTRKGSSSAASSKRPRSSSAAAAAASSSSSSSYSNSSAVPTSMTQEPKPVPVPSQPISVPVELAAGQHGPGSTDLTQMKDHAVLSTGYGSFASLLNGQSDGAFLALGSGSGSGSGLGYGFGYGFEEMGMGMGFLGGSVGTVPVTSNVGTVVCDTWQIGEMDGNNGGDSFVWPGLEISMQGNNVK